MWQLAMAATNASSGSTCAGFDHGAGTAAGDGEAGTVTPPSKVHVWSREYWPFEKLGPVRFHTIVARCSDMTDLLAPTKKAGATPRGAGLDSRSFAYALVASGPRRSLPGSAPVCWPFFSSTSPFTIVAAMP